MYSLELSPSSHSVHSADVYQRPLACQEKSFCSLQISCHLFQPLPSPTTREQAFMLEARDAQLPGVQLAQPLPRLSRGDLSARCLVNLWSGPWLSLLSIFILQAVLFSTSESVREEEVCVSVSL